MMSWVEVRKIPLGFVPGPEISWYLAFHVANKRSAGDASVERSVDGTSPS